MLLWFQIFRQTGLYKHCRPRSDCSGFELFAILSALMSCLVTKPTKWHVCRAKTQISLGIRQVWSESLLSAWRELGSLATQWVHSEDTDQTGRMPRLIWVFAGCTCHFVGFVTRRLICFSCIVESSVFFWQLPQYLSRVKRICVFEHSVMTNFNCACPDSQRG